MKNTLALLLLLTASAAAAQTYQVNGYELPTTMTDQTAYINDALPNITGITVPLAWSQIETSQGSYTGWTTFDGTLSPYIASSGNKCAGGLACKINFEINAASGSSPNSATPGYVLTSSWAFSCCLLTEAMDVCFCTDYPGSMGSSGCLHNDSDTTGVPASWQQPFSEAYETFVKEVISHYSSVSWSSQVGYIRFGLGVGGGGAIPCPSQEMGDPVGVKLSLLAWGSYASTIFSYAATRNPPMIIEGSGYGGVGAITTAWAEAVASAAISNGAGYGVESLALHDLTLYAEGMPCSNDWCASFNTYFIQSPPMLGLQTIGISDHRAPAIPGPGRPAR